MKRLVIPTVLSCVVTATLTIAATTSCDDDDCPPDRADHCACAVEDSCVLATDPHTTCPTQPCIDAEGFCPQADGCEPAPVFG